MRNAKDNHMTTEWAIAKVTMVSVVVVGIHFKLANRATGRAHNLYFVGGGFTLGVGGKVPFTSGKLEYKSFRTRYAVNFQDFHNVGARISGINVKLGIGYEKSYLTIWPGPAHGAKPLAKISMGGWTVGKIGIGGQAGTYGDMGLEYGDGEPHGLFPMVLELEEVYDPIERLVRVRSTAQESRLMAIPGDVLFGFDNHRINPAAHRFLQEAANVIQLRDRGRVEIAGHTDSVGNSQYNKNLSRKRSEAVKHWMIAHRVHNAQAFQIKGYGEENPIAPNKHEDGSDNPQGRQQNRRVEILFHY